MGTIPERITKPPRWLVNGNDTDNEQMTQDLISLAFWELIDVRARDIALKEATNHPEWKPKQKPELQSVTVIEEIERLTVFHTDQLAYTLVDDDYARMRFVAAAVDSSFNVSGRVEENMPMLRTRLLLKLQEEGLLPFLEEESIRTYLYSKLDNARDRGDRGGDIYDMVFMLETLVPLMERKGFSRELLLRGGKNFAKARAAMKYIRHILDDVTRRSDEIKLAMRESKDAEEICQLKGELDKVFDVDKRLYEVLESLFSEIALSHKEGGLTVTEFGEKIKRIMVGGDPNPPQPMLATLYNLKSGGILQISCETNAELRRLLRVLQGVIDLHQGDPVDLAVQASKTILASGRKIDGK